MHAWRKIPAFLIALLLPASGMAQTAQTAAPENAQNPPGACPTRTMLQNYDVYRGGALVRQLPIWHLPDDSAFFFSAGMLIDADGAPNAYNADNTGLDDIWNAGHPGHWDGVLQDQEGNPVVQGPADPFPGYYISCTALADWSKDRLDPARFVDASKIPYVALPGDLARATGARLGDLAAVFNRRNGKLSFAIFADIGALGEGSIALADSLGIWSDARRGGSFGGMVYVVFPGSGDHRPKAIEEINELGAKLLEDWGGSERMRNCGDSGNDFRRPWIAWPTPWDPEPIEPPKAATAEPRPAESSVAATSHANSN